MIEYDYKIERIEDETGGIVEYKPDKISKKLPSIVYIEGPNSSGKSTLLHIISLGFHGLKNEAIVKELREKMDNLINSDHQNITFKVCLTNRDNSIKLFAEKNKLKNKQIDVYELRKGDEKKHFLSPEVFEQKYKLIYDIPFDPTKRLNSLTNEINLQQISYGNKIGELRLYINELITEIIKRDPKKLEDTKARFDGFFKKKKDLEIIVPELEKDFELLEKSVYFKYYNFYKFECEKLKKELESLERSIKRKTKKIKTGTSNLTVVKRELRKKLFDLDDLRVGILKILKVILKKGDTLIEVWDQIDIHSTVQNCKFPDRLDFGIEQLNTLLIEREKKQHNDITFQEIKMFKDLVSLLSRYKNLSLKLPGLDQSITEFIENLATLINERQSVISRIENVGKTRMLLDNLKEQKLFLELNYLSKLSDLLKNIDKNKKEVEEELEEFTSSIELEQKTI